MAVAHGRCGWAADANHRQRVAGAQPFRQVGRPRSADGVSDDRGVTAKVGVAEAPDLDLRLITTEVIDDRLVPLDYRVTPST